MAASSVCMAVLSGWTIAGLASAGCDGLLGKEPNPGYCGSATCSPDAGGCRSNADCTAAGAGVCDVAGTTQCVQCTATDHGACTGDAPFCGADHACRACAAHEECDSNACAFATGSCAMETDVAYVSSTGADNSTCDRVTPCASIAAALTTGRHYVKIHGTIDGAVVVDRARTITLLSDAGAMLTRGAGGDVLTVRDPGTSLAIYDLAITGAQSASVGVSLAAVATLSLIRVTVSNNAAGGIASAGELTIDRSSIVNNGSGGPGISITGGSLSLAQSLVSGNRAGGVDVTGTMARFAIVSNKFVSNGSGDNGGSLIGAVNIRANFSSANLLEFNTFYKNLSTDGVGAAIQCAPSAFAARANIMFNNGTAANLDPTSGTCAHVYSVANPGTLPPGTGNQTGDPMFVSPTSGDFHLQAASPAIGAASPLAPLTGLSARDFDDHPRTPPVNPGALQ
jgi:hypothetical protein